MRKKLLILFLVVLLIVFQFLLSWWVMVFPLVFIGYLHRSAARAFWFGFSIIFFLWFLLLIYYDCSSNGIMSSKMIRVFFMPNKYLLFIASGIIGGIVGGLASLLGYYIKQPMKSKSIQES